MWRGEFVIHNNQNIPSNKPYDDSLWDCWTIYDKVEYVQNKDDCHNYQKIVSGNIVKYYRCAMKDAYEVNHDKKEN